MLILGIETSCDETSAALVEDGKNIISNIVYSQIEIHKKFNGVVPEIASRNHIIKILDVIDEAVKNVPSGKIDAVAVTNGPGLIGSLLVGLTTAKGISYTKNIPLIPVNHIEAHMYAPHLFQTIEFPYIALVVSGGHTLITIVKSFGKIKIIGSTIDDAIGEAFDKTAKLLGLGYPGGPVIDRLAKEGDTERMPEFRNMPVILPDKGNDRYNFSYSGLKTAIAFRLKNISLNEQNIRDISASFQKTAVEILIRKAKNALSDFNLNRLVISGGVAANSFLRTEFEGLKKEGIEIFTAPVEYCGDNAGMVAGRGYQDFFLGKTGDLRTEVFSRQPLIIKGKR